MRRRKVVLTVGQTHYSLYHSYLYLSILGITCLTDCDDDTTGLHCVLCIQQTTNQLRKNISYSAWLCLPYLVLLFCPFFLLGTWSNKASWEQDEFQPQTLHCIPLIDNLIPLLYTDHRLNSNYFFQFLSFEKRLSSGLVNISGFNMHFVSPHNRICKLSYCN